MTTSNLPTVPCDSRGLPLIAMPVGPVLNPGYRGVEAFEEEPEEMTEEEYNLLCGYPGQGWNSPEYEDEEAEEEAA